MGVSNQGILGNWKNKVGNVVGHIRQGRTIITVYQPDVANPRTENQLRVRSRFTTLVKFFKGSMSLLRAGLQSSVVTGTAFSQAIKLNNQDGVTGNYPAFAIDFPNIKLSQGGLSLPYSPSASYDNGEVTVIWTDNSGLGNAKAEDNVEIGIYNATKNEWLPNLDIASRSERTTTITTPSQWSGDAIHIWMFMRSSDGLVSNTQYLGTFTV